MESSFPTLEMLSLDRVFTEHGCNIVGPEVFSSTPWFDQEKAIRRSKHGNELLYLHPPVGFTSHVIWGSIYVTDEYMFSGVSLNELLEEAFNEGGKTILSGLSSCDNLIVEASIFSFDLLHSYLEWAGCIQEFLIVSPRKRLIFFHDEQGEYSIYTRDIELSPLPLRSVTDAALTEAFFRDKSDFWSSALDAVRIPHLKEEVLPYCMEGEYSGQYKF